MSKYTFAGTTAAPMSTVRARVESALEDEGFGVLTEIDVAATLKTKLGVDRSPYVLLGACSPRLADRALAIDPSIGALLPCNVVLRQTAGRQGPVVEVMDPMVALSITGSTEVAPIAAEAAERLRRVLVAVLAR